MNKIIISELKQSIGNIRIEMTRIEQLLGLESNKQAEMTFRDFVRKVQHLPETKGVSMFRNSVDCSCPSTFAFSESYKTLGDVPVIILAKLTDSELLKFRNIGNKAIQIFRKLLIQYSIPH